MTRLSEEQHMIVQWFEELFISRTIAFYEGKGHPTWKDPTIRVSTSDLLSAAHYLGIIDTFEQWFWNYKDWNGWMVSADMRFGSAFSSQDD